MWNPQPSTVNITDVAFINSIYEQELVVGGQIFLMTTMNEVRNIIIWADSGVKSYAYCRGYLFTTWSKISFFFKDGTY